MLKLTHILNRGAFCGWRRGLDLAPLAWLMKASERNEGFCARSQVEGYKASTSSPSPHPHGSASNSPAHLPSRRSTQWHRHNGHQGMSVNVILARKLYIYNHPGSSSPAVEGVSSCWWMLEDRASQRSGAQSAGGVRKPSTAGREDHRPLGQRLRVRSGARGGW